MMLLAAMTSGTVRLLRKKRNTGRRGSVDRAAKSRSPALVCGFFVRAPVFGGSDGRAQALPVSAPHGPGPRTRPSCHPFVAEGVAVFANRPYWSQS